MDDIIKKIKQKLNSGILVQLKIKVTAGAKNNSIEKFNEEIIRVKINKPPVNNKANEAVIEYFCEILDIPKSNISIIRGKKSTIKDLRIEPKSRIIKMV